MGESYAARTVISVKTRLGYARWTIWDVRSVGAHQKGFKLDNIAEANGLGNKTGTTAQSHPSSGLTTARLGQLVM